MSQLLRIFGVILVLGGIGHSFGITRLYISEGVPDVNRVLLDVWVGEAQLVGGFFYLAAFRAIQGGGAAWKGLAIGGALTVLTYAVPFIPVLLNRAPLMFQIAPTVYALGSAYVVWRVTGSLPPKGGSHEVTGSLPPKPPSLKLRRSRGGSHEVTSSFRLNRLR